MFTGMSFKHQALTSYLVCVLCCLSSPAWSQITPQAEGLAACAISGSQASTISESEPTSTREIPSLPGLFSPLQRLDTQLLVFNSRFGSRDNSSHTISDRAKIMTGMIMGFQGFDPSKEGADIALDEGSLKNKDMSRAYFRQERIDQVHKQVVASIMDLAIGVSSPSGTQGREIIASALATLQGIIGMEETEHILCAFQKLQKELDNSSIVVPQHTWTMHSRDRLLNQMTQAMINNDPVIAEVTTQLRKYNSRSRFSQNTAKVITTTLGIAGFVPTMLAPIAGVSNFVFTSATGGPEQEKLLRELYLSKCLAHRLALIQDDANKIMDAFFMGQAPNSQLLLICGRSLLENLCGRQDQIASQIFGVNASKSVHGRITRFEPYNPPTKFQPMVSQKVPGSAM